MADLGIAIEDRHGPGEFVFPESPPVSRLEQIARDEATKYAAAVPYPHIVLDGLFDNEVLERVLAEFPRAHEKTWIRHDYPAEVKLQSNSELDIPLFTRHFLYALNSASFLRFLEKLTSIDNLIGDPHFEGAGLHQIVPGGKLAIHADFNKHTGFGLDRRLNLLIYLNKDWKDEYGGHFELWDRDVRRMVKKVAPLFNRTVIFTTSRYSYHGHPDPLNCPEGMTRKSLALYYYSNCGEVDTEWDGAHSTLFQARPGERFMPDLPQIARDFTPPILWRAAVRALALRRR